MSGIEATRDGVVAIPVVGYTHGVLEFLMIGPLQENAKKGGERTLLIDGSKMEQLLGPEFPGGGVKGGESREQALQREVTIETEIDVGDDFLSRLKFVFEDFPIDQLRPELTHFRVAVALWYLNEEEKNSMLGRGAKFGRMNILTGEVYDKFGQSIELRPAHRDIIKFMAGIAKSLVKFSEIGEIMEVPQHEVVTVN